MSPIVDAVVNTDNVRMCRNRSAGSGGGDSNNDSSPYEESSLNKLLY